MKFTIVNSEAERREGLKALLRHIDRRARFNEAKDWRQAASAVLRLEPDMIVIDWHNAMRMADLRMLLSLPREHRRQSLLTKPPRPRSASSWARGSRGVVPRDLDPTLIVRALEMVLLGGHYVPANALDPTFGTWSCRRAAKLSPHKFRKGSKRSTLLSLRQHRSCGCLHMGSTNKIIAKTLGISEGTVKIHLGSIFQQLGAPNRAAAVAIYNGWQNRYLEVLRREADASPRPALGDAGLVPLRAPAALLTYSPRPEDGRTSAADGCSTSTSLWRLTRTVLSRAGTRTRKLTRCVLENPRWHSQCTRFRAQTSNMKIYGFLLHTSSALARNRWLDCHCGCARACNLEEPVSPAAGRNASACLVRHRGCGHGAVGVQYLVRRRSRHSSARRDADGHAVRLATRNGRHGGDDRSRGGRAGCLMARCSSDLLLVRRIARRRIVAAAESYPGVDSAQSVHLYPRSRFPHIRVRCRGGVCRRPAAGNRACQRPVDYSGRLYAGSRHYWLPAKRCSRAYSPS